MRQRVVEVALCGKKKEEKILQAARDFFLTNRIPPHDTAYFDFKDRFKLCAYLSRPTQARDLKRRFARTSHPGLKIQIKNLGPESWLDKWKRDYHIQPLSRRFLLVPVWEKKKLRRLQKRTPVLLDPGSAFGSGTHETTRLTVGWMEDLRGRFRDFLDLGTGTGILSVVAFHLGAWSGEGMDHDGASVRIARANVKRNGYSNSRIRTLDLRRFQSRKQFDLVAANLFSSLLRTQRKKIVARVRRGGHLIVSGILKKDRRVFMKTFGGPDLKTVGVRQARRWIAVCYRRA